MNIKEYLKKKSFLFIITFIILTIIAIISIYAFSNKNKEKDKVQEQNLKVVYNIQTDLLYPMSYEDGMKYAKTSTIYIKNNKFKSKKYKLIVKPTENNTLPFDRVYIKYDDKVSLLSDLKNGVVTHNVIKGKKDQILSFKTWVSLELLTMDDNNKVLDLNYEVIEE